MSRKDHANLMTEILQSGAKIAVGQYYLKDHMQNSLETGKGKQDSLCEVH